jgi:hypothetical protein
VTPEVRKILLDVVHRKGNLPDGAIGPVRRILLAEIDAAALRNRQILADRKRRLIQPDAPAIIAQRRAWLAQMHQPWKES